MDQSRPPLTKAKSLLDPHTTSKAAGTNPLNQEFVDSVMKSQVCHVEIMLAQRRFLCC